VDKGDRHIFGRHFASLIVPVHFFSSNAALVQARLKRKTGTKENRNNREAFFSDSLSVS
jgi:hypothetical protein